MNSITARLASRRGGETTGIQSLNTLSPEPRPTLAFTDDGPGKLSVFGPRHDNDHDDFRKIDILPTPDEILAVERPVYMPKKDLVQEQFLENGPARHLDTLFRHLRCDSTEILRDICYSAAQIAFLKTGTNPEEHVRHETRAGNRYFLYRNIKIEELLSHEHKSMVARVSYNCPGFMRGQKLYDSGRFPEGMLVALLELDRSSMEFSAYYMEVNLAQSTFSMDGFGGNGTRAAVQLSFLPTSSHDDVLQMCRYALELRPDSELYLVEFPKVLFAGFYNCLKCLQNMKDSDFAFSHYIASEMKFEEALCAKELRSAMGVQSQFPCQPPAYARAPDFFYNLSKLVPSNSPLASVSIADLSRPYTLDVIKRETTLDEGQAAAFRNSLMRDFACTQGPPGCGKTFLGVKLVQVLIDSRTSQKPVLLVCLTNHALDSFLGDLRDAGVKDLLRVGSGSKEEWTDSFNLRNLRRKNRFKKEEFSMFHSKTLSKKESIAELDSLCKAVSTQTHTGSVPWHYVEDVLNKAHHHVHAQFTTKAKFSLAQSFTFEYWSKGGDLKTIRDLHLELVTRLSQVSASHDRPADADIDKLLFDLSWDAELRSLSAGSSSIWNIALSEREVLLDTWEKQVDKESFAHKITTLYFQSRVHEHEIKKVQDERDARVMSSHNLIAMTSTACAARWEVLRSLDLEILLCEEAAELMEAHTLCSLLPSIQHAIFIGDPQQLRPETNEHSLSLESTTGRQYRLDESLLERLMLPMDLSASTMPASHLSIQRRMHPEIANITRLTYPYLKDHASTLERQPTYGLAKRLFWWDHRVPELESDDLKSHANLHEVEMVASLVEYLLRGGAYSQGEIAVLTPYAGQLLKLYERLTTTCDIWLSDKDRDALLEEEVLALGEEGRTTKDEVAISDMLRIATVDNFQGEEAAVIILSCVRSGDTAGFLRNLNRINVACSRARNGFYVIGDSQTLSQVPMWRQVIQTFNGSIGASIMTRCHVHPEHNSLVRQPQDFARVFECSAVCGQQLPCGHRCSQLCHVEWLHARLACQEECMTVFACGHKCKKRCYQTCGECQTTLEDVELSCGHQGQLLCSGDTSKCKFVVERKELECGHTVNILCGEDPDATIICQQPCGAWLPCQHTCMGKCGQCYRNKKHPPCAEICKNPKTCIHECKEKCHAGKPCPPECLEPCPDYCEHGPCKNRCQDTCDPCVKLAVPGCDHDVPDMLCCMPKLGLPCCQKCPETLSCGHACPSLCGEVCPSSEICPECTSGKVGPPVLYSSTCQHLAEVSQLDAINLQGAYRLSLDGTIQSVNPDLWLHDIHPPKCLCGAVLEGTRRYRLHTRVLSFENTFDLLLAKMGRKLSGFAESVESQEKRLSDSFESFVKDIRPNPLASRANTANLLKRTNEVLKLQRRIVDFRHDIVDAIQVDVGRLHEAMPNIVPSYTLMFHLRFDVLEYRVVSVRLSDTVQMGCELLALQDPSFGVQRQGLKMIEFVHKESLLWVNHCKNALNNPSITTSPTLAVEIRLHQLRFLLSAKSAGLRLADLGSPSENIAAFMDNEDIKASLDTIAKLVALSPGSCASFLQTGQELADVLTSDEVALSAPIPQIRNAFVRQTETIWAQHELGHLKLCSRHHPYSSQTFPKACPECEKHAQRSGNELFRESAKHLFEKDFLSSMRAKSPRPQAVDNFEPKSSKKDQASDDQAVQGERTAEQAEAKLSPSQQFLKVVWDSSSQTGSGKPSPDENDQKAAAESPGVVLVRSERQLTMEEKFLVAMKSGIVN